MTVKPILAHVVVAVEIKCGRPRENLHQTPQVASATSGRLTQSLKIEKKATSLGSRLTYHGLREQYTIEAARKGLHAFSPSQHVDGYEQLPDSPMPSEETLFGVWRMLLKARPKPLNDYFGPEEENQDAITPGPFIQLAPHFSQCTLT